MMYQVSDVCKNPVFLVSLFLCGLFIGLILGLHIGWTLANQTYP